MSSGIYCLENLSNGKKYIGKSVNIEKRFIYHRHLLNNNKHWNNHIQNSWNKNGENSFCFWIIEECEKEMLSKKEIYYIQFFNTKIMGYNNSDGGEGISNPTLETRIKMSKSQIGRKHPEETKIKISESNIGKHTCTKENKEKISLSNKGKKYFLGKHHTKETKKKMSDAKKGKIMSQEFKEKISKIVKGRPSKKKGIPISDKTKQKISDFWKRKRENKESIGKNIL
jgi:group I intron endonuclease